MTIYIAITVPIHMKLRRTTADTHVQVAEQRLKHNSAIQNMTMIGNVPTAALIYIAITVRIHTKSLTQG